MLVYKGIFAQPSITQSSAKQMVRRQPYFAFSKATVIIIPYFFDFLKFF